MGPYKIFLTFFAFTLDIYLALKLSQSDLAARLQTMDVLIEQKAISRIEVGDRVVADYELVALSKALGVTVYDLLGLQEPSAKQRHIKQK